MVEKHVLAAIKSAKLRVYYVWQPILPSDTLAAARAQTLKLHDRRAQFFWDADHRLGDAIGKTLSLTKGAPRSADGKHRVAWDMYLVYAPKTTWGTTPPKPTFWQHQLWGLSSTNLLNGTGLGALVRRHVPR